ncbi:MAG TPA: GDSL-type esterase/lipase family protein, partial [Acidimicrobiales bacterium]|nr:GDSL-type esterase/lipase family protein [Acidimicrobiales bacterium]
VDTCVSLLPLGSPCHDRYVGAAGDEISRRIAATGPRVAAALAEIRRRSPRARVFVVGYPAILPGGDAGCWPLLPFAFGDVGWLRDKEKELNSMLATAAAAGGAVYVDTYGPSRGHSACALPGDRWVEPVVPMSPADPVHPNARGMEGMAAAVLAAVRPGG